MRKILNYLLLSTFLVLSITVNITEITKQTVNSQVIFAHAFAQNDNHEAYISPQRGLRVEQKRQWRTLPTSLHDIQYYLYFATLLSATNKVAEQALTKLFALSERRYVLNGQHFNNLQYRFIHTRT